MSNLIRGSVTFDVKDKVYTLKLSTNAMCWLEDEFDMDVESLFNSLDPDKTGKSPRIGHMRKIVKAMLSDNHSELSLDDVGNLIDEYGLQPIFEKVEQALTSAFPEQDGKAGK